MRILTRYVLIEETKVFLVALTAMTALMLIVGVMREAVEQGLGLTQIALLLPYIVPDALRFAIPGTILFAVCGVYGRMSGSNEVVAIKSLGISPLAILAPTWVAVFLLSLLTVWINDVAVSWGQAGIQRVVIEGVEEIAYGMLRTKRSYANKNFSINVKRVDERRLIQPMITFSPNDDSPPVTVTAEWAEMHADPASNQLTVALHNGYVNVGDQVTVRFPDTYERVIPLRDASRAGNKTALPAYMPLRVIPDEAAKQRERIAENEQELAAKAAFQMLTGEFETLSGPEWDNEYRRHDDLHGTLSRLETEPWRRWAGGFSCFCFVWIGAPVAIWLRRAETLTIFFACFLPILLVYYPLLAYGIDAAKRGSLPPYSVWLGNVMLLAIGGWFLRKVWRH